MNSGNVDIVDELIDENQQAGQTGTAFLAQRLVADEPNRLAAFQVETDIVEDLRRTNNLTRSIAKILLEDTGDSRDSAAD